MDFWFGVVDCILDIRFYSECRFGYRVECLLDGNNWFCNMVGTLLEDFWIF